jgi:hypothetical protein
MSICSIFQFQNKLQRLKGVVKLGAPRQTKQWDRESVEATKEPIMGSITLVSVADTEDQPSNETDSTQQTPNRSKKSIKLPFRANDLEDTTIILRNGDEVEFSIAVSIASGDQRATGIVRLRSAAQRDRDHASISESR